MYSPPTIENNLESLLGFVLYLKWHKGVKVLSEINDEHENYFILSANIL